MTGIGNQRVISLRIWFPVNVWECVSVALKMVIVSHYPESCAIAAMARPRTTHVGTKMPWLTQYTYWMSQASSASQMLSTASVITRPKRVRIGYLYHQWKVRTE